MKDGKSLIIEKVHTFDTGQIACRIVYQYENLLPREELSAYLYETVFAEQGSWEALDSTVWFYNSSRSPHWEDTDEEDGYNLNLRSKDRSRDNYVFLVPDQFEYETMMNAVDELNKKLREVSD